MSRTRPRKHSGKRKRKVSGKAKRPRRGCSMMETAVQLITEFDPFLSDGTLQLQVLFGAKTPLTQQNRILGLARENMKAAYEAAGWGWEDADKAQELFHEESLLLIVYHESGQRGDKKRKLRQNSDGSRMIAGGDSSRETSAGPSVELDEIDAFLLEEEAEAETEDRDQPPVAVLNVRFEMDEGRPCIYIYEVQVAQSHRGQKIGEKLMGLVHRVAAELGRTVSLLTVFKANHGALRFYRRLGYKPDITDPEECGDPDETHHILARPLSREEFSFAADGDDDDEKS